MGLGRCEQRNEVFVKNKNKMWGGGFRSGGCWLWGGVGVELNEELKFL